MNLQKNNSLPKQIGLLALTWPIFIEMFLHMLMGSTDTFMLSHISDDAVAAVGVANQLVFFMILVFGFVATGTAVLVSQNLGAGLQVNARKISGLSLSLNLIFGVLVSIIVVGFNDLFLQMFNLTPEIHRLAQQYLTIVGGTLFTQALLVTASAILRANGLTKEAMFISIIMNVIHLAGNSLFIYGLFGVPEMGVQGVAISTAISRAIAVILIFRLLYRRLPMRIALEDYLNFNKSFIKKILKIGIPSAGENVLYNTSQMAITVIIGLLGAMALTTRVYTFNIMSFMMLFGIAIGQGTQILIGYKVGAREFDKAYHQLLKSLKLSIIITMAITVVIVSIREPILGIFTDNKEIIREGSKVLLLCLLLEPGRTFNIVVISSLRAAGDAVFPVKMAFVSMWGISVPLAYILGITLDFGLSGIWMAFIVDEWFRGIVMYIRWRSRVWEKKVLVDDRVQTA
ncbi:MATE family efflux transporter [Mesobacillus subterraneus]|uniref:MATE family efflux transporter n=1 Tax=Mesobacillus subterraneus TaxID=285983 RepID=UPI00203A81D1|nr:MATE family efflux transporter [Mesobacillus subterraneus]MCM3665172.1 MATE family efflux transporter [Mesobacillus subterraneus]MCM3684185.1 MATE family efflux transporter [Mesobacillus subterraneus]